MATEVSRDKTAWQPHRAHDKEVSALLYRTPAAEVQRESPHLLGLCCLIPCPGTTGIFTDVLALGAFVFFPQDPGRGSQPPLTLFSGAPCPTLWEQHLCLLASWKQVEIPLPTVQRATLAQGGAGTGQGRGKGQRMEEQWVHLAWGVTHPDGEKFREICCALLAARPALSTSS